MFSHPHKSVGVASGNLTWSERNSTVGGDFVRNLRIIMPTKSSFFSHMLDENENFSSTTLVIWYKARIECKFSQTTPNCWWVSNTVNSIRINLFPLAKIAAKNLKFKIRNWVRVQCLGSIGFLDQVTPCPAVPHSFVLPSHNVNSVGYKLYSTDSAVEYSINSIK